MKYEFEVDRSTARRVLTEWVHPFGERNPQEEV